MSGSGASTAGRSCWSTALDNCGPAPANSSTAASNPSSVRGKPCTDPERDWTGPRQPSTPARRSPAASRPRSTAKPPTADANARRLGLPLEDVLEGLSARQVYRNDSLDRSTGSGDEPLADQLGDLDHGIEDVEYREALAPLLAALSDRERTILILRFFGNRTQSQIAEVIGVSQMQVSRLLDRTLQRLRHQLDADG